MINSCQGIVWDLFVITLFIFLVPTTREKRAKEKYAEHAKSTFFSVYVAIKYSISNQINKNKDTTKPLYAANTSFVNKIRALNKY